VRIIFDTNTLVSKLLFTKSVPGKAFSSGLRLGQILMSNDTFEELSVVLSRPKFNKYVTLEDRQQFLRLLSRVVEIIPIIKVVQQCRDPEDDKLLELAINGSADYLITGDEDLLVLKQFGDTKILTAAQFINSIQ